MAFERKPRGKVGSSEATATHLRRCRRKRSSPPAQNRRRTRTRVSQARLPGIGGRAFLRFDAKAALWRAKPLRSSLYKRFSGPRKQPKTRHLGRKNTRF